jgi:hypothetical protein
MHGVALALNLGFFDTRIRAEDVDLGLILGQKPAQISGD